MGNGFGRGFLLYIIPFLLIFIIGVNGIRSVTNQVPVLNNYDPGLPLMTQPIVPPGTENWRSYDDERFAFRYPDGWADVIVDETGERKRIVSEGTFEMEVGAHYDEATGRDMNFAEYIDSVIIPASNGQAIDYPAAGLDGKMYADLDENGNTVLNVTLFDPHDETTIYSITYHTNTPPGTAGLGDPETLMLETVLSTLVFKY